MYIYVYIYICICVYRYTHVHMHIYICVCLSILCICLHTGGPLVQCRTAGIGRPMPNVRQLPPLRAQSASGCQRFQDQTPSAQKAPKLIVLYEIRLDYSHIILYCLILHTIAFFPFLSREHPRIQECLPMQRFSNAVSEHESATAGLYAFLREREEAALGASNPSEQPSSAVDLESQAAQSHGPPHTKAAPS